jgi:hypothetical protein
VATVGVFIAGDLLSEGCAFSTTAIEFEPSLEAGGDNGDDGDSDDEEEVVEVFMVGTSSSVFTRVRVGRANMADKDKCGFLFDARFEDGRDGSVVLAVRSRSMTRTGSEVGEVSA